MKRKVAKGLGQDKWDRKKIYDWITGSTGFEFEESLTSYRGSIGAA